MEWPRFLHGDLLGVRFAINVFVASALLWFLLRHVADTNPIWAIASMVAASDPQVKEAARMFRSRIVNVLVGCTVGLLVLVVGGSSEWKLPFALAVSVLLSSYVVHIQTMWRQAPITAAIVIAGLSSPAPGSCERPWLLCRHEEFLRGKLSDLPDELCHALDAQEMDRRLRAAAKRNALDRVSVRLSSGGGLL